MDFCRPAWCAAIVALSGTLILSVGAARAQDAPAKTPGNSPPGNSPSTKSPSAKAPVKHEVAGLGLTLIRLEPGEFLMGSPADEQHRKDNETQHKVTLTKPFFLQATEVSQKQYQELMGVHASYFKGDDLPVEKVTWEEAVRFCEALSKREKRKFRLPTDAEWEYAARAGKSGPVSGTGKLEEMSWHANNSGKPGIDAARLWDENPNAYFRVILDNGCKTRPVGTGVPNDWGLHDMQGNVTEWVADWYSKEYFSSGQARTDPTGPAKSELASRAMRGGSWGSDPRNCRIARREWNAPTSRSGSRGFRVAMDVE